MADSDMDSDSDYQAGPLTWRSASASSLSRPASKSASFDTLDIKDFAASTSASIQARIFKFRRGDNSKGKERQICTIQGEGAGETETEVDDPPSHLPTARMVHPKSPLIPPEPLQQTLTPLLFQFALYLCTVPAITGAGWCIWCLRYSPTPSVHPSSYISALVWSLITAHLALAMSTGLLTRWRVYYPPLPTLIRLLAFHIAIEWPLTWYMMLLFDGWHQPQIAWALVGTCTAVSRSIQIWVVSNLWWEHSPTSEGSDPRIAKVGYWHHFRGGRWGGRRWDWNQVLIHCGLPIGFGYFIMAWAGELGRVFGQSC